MPNYYSRYTKIVLVGLWYGAMVLMCVLEDIAALDI